ncbi:benzoate/H(+) symporter BenE family transporter [Maribrevibacterium harenarium]|uniref:Benzoate/H(+) symporter BenE family transporter n=1 Tax=Maribrevibacterium harenarium TaxID=2589817 RepID=A0A501X4X4_9GAMM|nr:benzoate/H(+) symporter BenE family transporter [Maribrevibacterium harenarium]TPE55600.1 benzoate/H(+) symporter BenE family transporter [Maribrevibacterium harenarium]
MSLLKDISPSTISAGFVAVLVGFASSVAIVFQAANSAGANEQQVVSWIFALGIGMGVTCIGLSWYYRAPVITAWSTPGAALLATSLDGLTYAEAIGVFIFTGALIFITGISGLFGRFMAIIPTSIASAMLVGVLVPFGYGVFTPFAEAPWVIGLMLVSYLLAKLWLPRYAVILVLVVAIICAFYQVGESVQLNFSMSTMLWQTPDWNIGALIGVGIPLFIVTMSSQNIPGVAVLKAEGYQTPISPLISTTGLVNMVMAPFGGFAFNLAAITAAICAGKESHEDKNKRYVAGIFAGIFYLIAGVFGATLVALFFVIPSYIVAALAGIALFTTIANNLHVAMADVSQREAALLTFLVTASGVSFMGVASAFWGILVGLTTYYLFAKRAV